MKYLIKVLQSQDLKAEFFIKNEYLGRDKFFPDPYTEDIVNTGKTPRVVNIFLTDSVSGASYPVVIKTFIKPAGGRQDTRVAPVTQLFLNLDQSDGTIIIFEKIDNTHFNYRIFPVNEHINKRIRFNLLGSDTKYLETGPICKLVTEIIPSFRLTYSELATKYQDKISSALVYEKGQYRFEERINAKYSDGKEISFNKIILKLRSPELFTAKDENDLSNFILCISDPNGVFGISNWINNFKSGSNLPSGAKLKLFQLFNSIKSALSLSAFQSGFPLSKGLSKFIHLLFYGVKYLQDERNYFIFYTVHYKLFQEIFKDKFELDDFLEFYRTFPEEDRMIKFSAYWKVIANGIADGINNIHVITSDQDEEYIFLCGKKNQRTGKYGSGGLLHISEFKDKVKIYSLGTLPDITENSDKNKVDNYNPPLNVILYGPPGTGKTYTTISRALKIIGIKFVDYSDAQIKFSQELGKRIEFVTMHQNFSYEDFVQGLKPIKSVDGLGGIKFEYVNGVFKRICHRASDCITGDDVPEADITLTNSEILKIAFFLSKYNGKGREQKKANEFLNLKSDNDAFNFISGKTGENPNSIKNHRDKFDFMFTNREGYTARSGWKPQNKNGVLDNYPSWSYKDIYDEMESMDFDEVCTIVSDLLKKKTRPEIKVEGNNNHVIILDEINRANISRVLGELIALIEKDKRDGKLTVTLPSGELFTVPSNLYIIGTMNTADKSIALVDIALRRRFRFEALYPEDTTLRKVLEENKCESDEIDRRVYIMNSLNRIIRSKKSVDFEIGHSYFMEDESLENIINEQVIPLLNEYFMYDLKTVKHILENQQRDVKNNLLPKVGLKLDTNYFEERGLLRIATDSDGVAIPYVIPKITISNQETDENNEEDDIENA